MQYQQRFLFKLVFKKFKTQEAVHLSVCLSIHPSTHSPFQLTKKHVINDVNPTFCKVDMGCPVHTTI